MSLGLLFIMLLAIVLGVGELSATGDVTIIVTSPANSGPGTLRQALLDTTPGGTIVFDTAVFPPNSPATIFVFSPLPALTAHNVIIDASEAGVILDGFNAPGSTNGFLIQADGCTIRGFIIQRFPGSGIFVDAGADNNTIGGDRNQGNGPTGQGNVIGSNGGDGIGIWGNNNNVRGNYVGIEVTGQYDWGNSFSGVAIWQGASGNTVGGTINGYRNVISGNDNNGVWIGQAGSNANVIIGNYIGTTANGSGPVPNSFSGVAIQGGAQSNKVGDTINGAGNLISGNADNGVYISDPGTTGNQVLGNIIGLNSQGNATIGQGLNGVVIANAGGNIIGNENTNGRNVISGAAYDGIVISGANAANNTVRANFVGTNLMGTASLPNGLHGVEIREGAHDNLIGGNRLSGQGNLLSGNGNHGLVLTENAHHNTIQGNLIGPNAMGTASLGRHPFGGIDIANGAHHNIIGGAVAGQGNVISGNQTDGIALFGSGTTDNQVTGNLIGVAVNGSPLPNIKGTAGTGGFGILNTDGANRTIMQNNTISHNEAEGVLNGGNAFDTLIQNNTISFNGSNGIKLNHAGCAGIQITQNSIFGHTEEGIAGSCHAAPDLFASSLNALTGTTTPNARVEFFSDDDNEGRRYEGFVIADGNGDFSFTPPGGFSGPNVIATSNDASNNTSAFSRPLHLRWTMLLYLNGDNDLESFMEDTLENMVAAGPAPTANVLVLLDRSESDSALYDVTYGQAIDITDVFTTSNEVNMGAGETLVQFVNWSRNYYPVTYTMLSIVDHGGGWAPSLSTIPTGTLPVRARIWLSGGSGLSWDFTSEYDYLSSPEIRQAMADIEAIGGPLDVVFYDVCLMGMSEVAYQIREYASFFVSSQNIGWAPLGPQNRYVRTMQGILPDATPQDVAGLLVENYQLGLPLQGHPFTISAVDLSQMDEVADAVNQLGLILTQTLTTPEQMLSLFTVYTDSQKIDYNSDFIIEPEREGFVDLYDFALKLTQSYTDPAILAAAQTVLNRLGTTIVAEAHRSDIPWFAQDEQEWNLDDVHGLSIYLPLGEDLEFQIRITDTSPISPNISITRNLRLRDLYNLDELQFVGDAPAWRSLIEQYYELIPTTVITSLPGGPLPGLQEPDVTPPQTTITVPPIGERQTVITLTWAATDTQNEVVSASLWYLSPTGEEWRDTDITQLGSSGVFTYPLTCGMSGFAVRASDDVGNVESIESEFNSIFPQQTCYLYLPVVSHLSENLVEQPEIIWKNRIPLSPVSAGIIKLKGLPMHPLHPASGKFFVVNGKTSSETTVRREQVQAPAWRLFVSRTAPVVP